MTRPAATTPHTQLQRNDQAIQTASRQLEKPESESRNLFVEKVLPPITESFTTLAEAKQTEELSKAPRSLIQPSSSTTRVDTASFSSRGTAATCLRLKLKALSQKFEEFEEIKPHTLQCAVQFTSNSDGSQEESNLERRASQLQFSSFFTGLISCSCDSLVMSNVPSQKKELSESDSLVYSE